MIKFSMDIQLLAMFDSIKWQLLIIIHIVETEISQRNQQGKTHDVKHHQNSKFIRNSDWQFIRNSKYIQNLILSKHDPAKQSDKSSNNSMIVECSHTNLNYSLGTITLAWIRRFQLIITQVYSLWNTNSQS